MAENKVYVDMQKVMQIESSGRRRAYNKRTGATGLWQVTQSALDDWNKYHPKEQYTLKQLFSAELNRRIADWYMNRRIPQMLRAYKIPDSVAHRLISYNAGVGNLKACIEGRKPLPKETKEYLRKYGIQNYQFAACRQD